MYYHFVSYLAFVRDCGQRRLFEFSRRQGVYFEKSREKGREGDRLLWSESGTDSPLPYRHCVIKKLVIASLSSLRPFCEVWRRRYKVTPKMSKVKNWGWFWQAWTVHGRTSSCRLTKQARKGVDRSPVSSPKESHESLISTPPSHSVVLEKHPKNKLQVSSCQKRT